MHAQSPGDLGSNLRGPKGDEEMSVRGDRSTAIYIQSAQIQGRNSSPDHIDISSDCYQPGATFFYKQYTNRGL